MLLKAPIFSGSAAFQNNRASQSENQFENIFTSPVRNPECEFKFSQSGSKCYHLVFKWHQCWVYAWPHLSKNQLALPYKIPSRETKRRRYVRPYTSNTTDNILYSDWQHGGRGVYYVTLAAPLPEAKTRSRHLGVFEDGEAASRQSSKYCRST